MKKIVDINGQKFEYNTTWSGEVLEGNTIAFDTETVVPPEEELLKPQKMVLATVSNGKISYFLKPSQVAEFIKKHSKHHFVFQNIAFDFWVVHEELKTKNECAAVEIWFEMVEENRAHDTMLLDMLYDLARYDTYPVMKDLAVLAKKYTELELDKKDPYRTRYAEILDRNFDDVDQGFIEYGIKDPVVTYYVFLKLYPLSKKIARESGVTRECIEKFGPLTEAVQIKGAIALTKIMFNGIFLDVEYGKKIHALIREHIDETQDKLLKHPVYSQLFKTHKKTGELLLTKKGGPQLSIKLLREILLNVAKEIQDEYKIEVKVPKTEKGFIGTSMKDWADYKKYHPFLIDFTGFMENLKLAQFFQELKVNYIQPKYGFLKKTGRTSSYDINIQQLPRKEGIREVFQASPGFMILAVDYKYIELRTLAFVCEELYGKSVLADVIREGRDPHCFTASMLLGLDFKNYMKLEETDPKKFKTWRQNAKITNFGLPGGLSAKSLVHYAHAVYKLNIDLDFATNLRNKWINEVYPEMKDYLSEDAVAIMARNLRTNERRIWEKFDWTGERSFGIIGAARNIIKGAKLKKDGTPYNENFVRRCWENFSELNNNPAITPYLKCPEGLTDEQRDEVHKLIFWDRVITTTGRIRGKVSFSQCKNTPFQALAADGAKLALWRLTEQGFKIIGFIHDEILVEIPDRGGYILEADAQRVIDIMCNEMKAITGKVPIGCDYVVNKKWKKDGKIKVENGRIYPI